MGPTSSVLEYIRQRYRRVFSDGVDFTGVPSRHTITMIDALIGRHWSYHIWRDDDKPSDHEHVAFARHIAELAQAEYQREQEVPKWILAFVFNSLSLDSLPQTSIVADCLKVVAIDLGCDVSNVVTSDERCIFSSY